MKRLFYVTENFSVKMFEAPVTWQRFPNASRRVTTAAVRSTDFHDLDRLFSALIRVVRREMTFNEASASHHISLNLIKEVYKKIFITMSDIMMRLMKDEKTDIELKGEEMDESGFHFDQVSEESLSISTNEKGEEYAIVDTSNNRLKKNRMDPTNENIPSSGPLRKEVKEEPATDYTQGRGLPDPCPKDVSMVKEGMEPPQPLPVPPEKMMNDWEIKKEIKEEPIEPPLEHVFKNVDEEECHRNAEPLFKNDYDVDREIKDEPIDDSPFSISNNNEIGSYVSMEGGVSRVKMEEEEEPQIFESLKADHHSTSTEPGKPLDSLDSERIQAIRDGICAVTRLSPFQGEEKEVLKTAVFTICVGEMTIAEASKRFNINDTTLHANVQKTRLRLGSILPPDARIKVSTRIASGIEDEIFPIREGNVTIDGITLPKSVQLVNRMLSIGKLDYSKSKIFQGTKIELREKLVTIIQAFNFRGDIGNLADVIIYVYVNRQKISDVCDMYKMTKSNVHSYFRVIKIFINFDVPIHDKFGFIGPGLEFGFIRPGDPSARLASKPEVLTRNEHVLNDDTMLEIREEEGITIDGITVPKSITLFTWWLSIGRLDYSKAQPFQGTEDELREKLKSIILAFKFKGDLGNIVDAIMHVCVYQGTYAEVRKMFNISCGVLGNYVKSARVFIDFYNSQCTKKRLLMSYPPFQECHGTTEALTPRD